MINNKSLKDAATKQAELAQMLKEIDIIFSATVKKLNKLHLEKMQLLKKYQEIGREEEIGKIRKSLKNI